MTKWNYWHDQCSLIKLRINSNVDVQTKSEWKTVKLTCSPLLFVEPVGLPFTLSSQEKVPLMKRIEQLTFRQEVWTRFSSLYSAIFKLSWLRFTKRQPEQKVESSPSYLNSCPRNPFKIKSDLSKKMYYHHTIRIFATVFGTLCLDVHLTY
jgi:hypothetical protein